MQKIDIYLINNRKISNTIFQLQQTSNINYKLITCINNKDKISFKRNFIQNNLKIFIIIIKKFYIIFTPV